MKKILLTGANGFIGRHVLEELKKRGDYEVHALSSRDFGPGGPGCIWHQADLINEKDRRSVWEKIAPTHLMHLAWYTEPGQYWSSDKNYQWVRASDALIREFRVQGGCRLVATGTCAEYDWLESEILSERGTPLTPTSVYGQCKKELFSLTEKYSKDSGLKSAWARIFYTFGPFEKPDRLIPSAIRSCVERRAMKISGAERERDFMYVKDVADALVTLLESSVEGPVNIASGRSTSFRRIVELIGNEFYSSDNIVFGPVQDNPGEPKVLIGDPCRLNKEVNWVPRFTIEEGIKETVCWWKAQKKESISKS